MWGLSLAKICSLHNCIHPPGMELSSLKTASGWVIIFVLFWKRPLHTILWPHCMERICHCTTAIYTLDDPRAFTSSVFWRETYSFLKDCLIGCWLGVTAQLTCQWGLNDRPWSANQHAQMRRSTLYTVCLESFPFGTLSLTHRARLAVHEWVRKMFQ